MLKSNTENDIRVEFKNFDPVVLLNASEVAQIIGAKNTATVYAMVYRGQLPHPLIQKNRQLRWSVGQMREHHQSLVDDFNQRRVALSASLGEVCAEVKKKFGRPRKEARPILFWDKLNWTFIFQLNGSTVTPRLSDLRPKRQSPFTFHKCTGF